MTPHRNNMILFWASFFTLIAATRHPLLFRSAVDVAGVVAYTMYYEDPYHGDWTASRIGTPEQNPAGYLTREIKAAFPEVTRVFVEVKDRNAPSQLETPL